MIYSFNIVVLIFFSILGYSQNLYWDKLKLSIAGSNPYNIEVDESNNLYVSGKSIYIAMDTFEINGNGNTNVVLAKIGSDYNTDWLKGVSFSQSGDIYSNFFSLSNIKNNKLNIGLTYINDMIINNTNYSSSSGDLVLLELNTNSDLEKIKTVEGDCGNWIFKNCIKRTADKTYFSGVFGSELFNDTCPAFVDDIILEPNNDGDIFVISVNSDWQINSSFTFGGSSADIIRAIDVKNQFIYISGQIKSNQGNFGNLPYSHPSSFTDAGFIAKMDTMGNTYWIKHFGTKNVQGDIFINNLDVYSDNQIRILFNANHFDNLSNKDVFFQGNYQIDNVNNYEYTPVIAEFDSLGNVKWAKIIRSNESINVTKLVNDFIGNIFVCGHTNGNLNFANQTFVPSNANDIFVLKYDYEGTELDIYTASGNNNDITSDMTIDNIGNLHIVGTSTSTELNFGDITKSAAIGNKMFIARLGTNPYINITETENIINNNFQVFPNPSKNYFYVKKENNQQIKEIALYNHIGEQQNVEFINSGNVIRINTQSLSNGIYYLNITSNFNFTNLHQTKTIKKLLFQN